MEVNMGTVDRKVRMVLGVLLLVLAATNLQKGLIFWLSGFVGIVFLLSSVSAFCPLYVPLNLSTADKPKLEEKKKNAPSKKPVKKKK